MTLSIALYQAEKGMSQYPNFWDGSFQVKIWLIQKTPTANIYTHKYGKYIKLIHDTNNLA